LCHLAMFAFRCRMTKLETTTSKHIAMLPPLEVVIV